MLPELDALLTLQREETKLLDVRRRRDEIPGRRADLKRALDRAKEDLERSKKDLEQARLARRTLEKEVEAFEAERIRFERQLLDVKTNEAYTAMLHEIEGVKAKRSDHETRILEGFEQEERLAALLKQCESRVATEEANLKAGEADLAKEEADLDQAIHSLTQDRDAVKPRIPPALLARYDRLIGARDGVAVAEIRKGACGACFRGLTPQAMQEAKLGEKVQSCEACGRILVYTDGSGT